MNKCKTPFPWFGGKSGAAPAVWEALGDVEHYVEPFAGSLAVLLRRPHTPNRTYFSETVNDLDGLLVNAWRAIAYAPDEVAEAASWPVAEADLHARHVALLKWKAEALPRLMGSPDYFDARMAGWWLWGQCSWIGSGWCSGQGPWWVDERGCLVKRGRGGVSRQRPHLGNGGQGVNRPQLREEGVSRQLPHLGNDGKGVNHAGLREEGCGEWPEWHPMAMPELRQWMRYLSARLRHVRILNGDWKRACTGGALLSLSVRQGGTAGVFLDPPYLDEVRTAGIYAEDHGTIAHDVREWAREWGKHPSVRIVLAGFDTEHEALEREGWRVVEWFKAGFLTGGMANTSTGGSTTQQHRERLWLSPGCLEDGDMVTEDTRQMDLFGLGMRQR